MSTLLLLERYRQVLSSLSIMKDENNMGIPEKLRNIFGHEEYRRCVSLTRMQNHFLYIHSPVAFQVFLFLCFSRFVTTCRALSSCIESEQT